MAAFVRSLDPSPVMATCAVCRKGELQTRERRNLYGLSSAIARAQLNHLAICVGYSVNGENSIVPAESDQRSFLCLKCFNLLERAATTSKDLAELERTLENNLNETAASLGVTRQFPRSLPGSHALSRGPMEIVFSFDTTGSMYSCLDQVRQNITETVQRLKSEIPGIRIAIIGHGDYCDGHNTIRIMDFSSDRKKLCYFVNNIPKTDGGDEPECYELVLNEVREKLSWTPGTQRSLVMIGDATPHPPTDPQNRRKLDWRVEAKKLHDHLGVRIYAVQVINEPDLLRVGVHTLASLFGVHVPTQTDINAFYRDLASLTGGRHLHLNDFSSVVDMLMAICLREQSPEHLQAYEEEVRKRDSGVNPSTQRLFDELTDKDITSSGSRERIILLTSQLAEIDEWLRLHREQIQQSERELIQLQVDHESRKALSIQELQDIKDELKKQQDQFRHHADLLQNNQCEQLSQDLGLPEERSKEVLAAHIADEKRKVAATELQATITQHEQLKKYQVQARDLAGRLQNYIDLLESHMVELEKRKKALEDLESCGEKYTKELMECDEKLKQLQEKLKNAQVKLRDCKGNFQKYIEQLEECLDEMNGCEGTLRLSRRDFSLCLDRLEKLREKLTQKSSGLKESIWMSKMLSGVIIQDILHLFGYSNDQLEGKRAELQKCSTELEETEHTLEECKETVQKFEKELEQLKESVKEANLAASRSQIDDDRETQSEISTSRSWEYQTMSNNSPAIISALADNSLAESLADELKSRELIGPIVYDNATSYGPGITEHWKVKRIITAMLSKIEHTPQRYHDFIDVLKLDHLRVDAESALVLLPSGPPVEH